MPLYPLGISRRRDIAKVPLQAAGSVNLYWSLSGDLACAFIDAPHQAVPPMLHATVLDAIHRRICVLPVRFGLALHDESEIHALLHNRHRELLDDLSRLDQTCEMGLQISLTTAAKRQPLQDAAAKSAPAPCPNTQTQTTVSFKPLLPLAYIEERRSHYQKADEDAERHESIVQQLVERLNGCFRQWRKLRPSLSHPIRLAFLIEQGRVAAFRSRLENACRSDQRQCVILGPWPPYSFV
jgi:hypothetical protein